MSGGEMGERGVAYIDPRHPRHIPRADVGDAGSRSVKHSLIVAKREMAHFGDAWS